jgi:excisionase family DNA binding protein
VKLSASQAAKRTGKSIPTITRAIKSGKLSAEKTGSGGYQIEASELFRVFKAVTETPNVTDDMLHTETPREPRSEAPDERLLREKIETLETALSDAKAERDEWRDQAKRLALALPPPETQAPPKRGLWRRLTGR